MVRVAGSGKRPAMTQFSRVATYANGARAPQRGLFSSGEQLELHAATAPRVEISRAVVGEVTVGRVASTGHDVGLRESLSVTLLMPLTGKIETEIGERTISVRPGEAMLLGRGRRETRVTPDGGRAFLGVPILLPPHLLPKALPIVERLRGVRLLPGRSRYMAQVIRTARLLYDEAEAGSGVLDRPRAARSWTDLLSDVIDDAVQDAGDGLPPMRADGSSAARHVRRAEEFMHANYGDIATIADVARELGVSARTLELSFRQVRDTSPAKVLAALRQHEARRLLLSPDGPATVTEVCLECGIGHPGRFAKAYRQLFDETPARTLARR